MKIKKEKQKLAIDEREGAGGKGESGETGVGQKGDVHNPLSSSSQGLGTPLGGGTRADDRGDFPYRG